MVLLNSDRPYSEETGRLAKELEKQYSVTVMPVNCEQLKREDVHRILEKVLKEFPVTEVDSAGKSLVERTGGQDCQRVDDTSTPNEGCACQFWQR